MPTVAAALRQHADDYLNRFGPKLPHEHKRVLALVTRCRTGELGHLRYQCDTCPEEHWVGRSCGNRHCPNCQNDKTQAWLANRMAQLLPVPYYLVTFTVPQSLRMIVRANQRVCYQALFDCGSQTIIELAAGKRFIGSDRLGFFGALHTWGRDFTVYNPHVHFVVPGGGVQPGRCRMAWRPPKTFCLPEQRRQRSIPANSVTRCGPRVWNSSSKRPMPKPGSAIGPFDVRSGRRRSGRAEVSGTLRQPR